MINYRDKVNHIQFDTGSFRDPNGRVFYLNDNIYRTLSRDSLKLFEDLKRNGVYERLVNESILQPADILSEKKSLSITKNIYNRILQHKKISYISYSYEWPFDLLKKAAIAHIDLHLLCLKEGYSLIDGNTYNIQFEGTSPRFIDTLSIVPYKDGDAWLGYKQFCEQFIAPLLFTADMGIPYHSWLRGSPHGIPLSQIKEILPFKKYFNFNRLIHIILHEKLQKKYSSIDYKINKNNFSLGGMSKRKLENFLKSLKQFLSSLENKSFSKSEWQEYENLNHYEKKGFKQKETFLINQVSKIQPKTLFDLGCNTGTYSKVSLKNGAKKVIGFDIDHGALNVAVKRNFDDNDKFLPLYFDVLNPSPNLGWAEKERGGFINRSNADMTIALALIHHVVISGGIPLREVIKWLTKIAKKGIIEFVTKDDIMVKKLLSNRKDHFEDYNVDAFLNYLNEFSNIKSKKILEGSSRILVSFES